MKKNFFLILLLISKNEYATWDHGNIHIFGDSHSAFSFTNFPNIVPSIPLGGLTSTFEASYFDYQDQTKALHIPFFIHWISNTMHVVGRSGLQGLDFKKYEVQNDDIAVLHFGGIDSYHGHIEKQFMKGRELNEIIETLTETFIETLKSNQKFYNKLTIIIMAVLPPIIRADNKNDFIKQITSTPYEEFIVLANHMLNDSLGRHCKINNFLYLNVNALFEDSNGILRLDMSHEHHVKPHFNYLIKQELIKLILENSAKRN